MCIITVTLYCIYIGFTYDSSALTNVPERTHYLETRIFIQLGFLMLMINDLETRHETEITTYNG